MKAAVWKVGKWTSSKYEFETKRVIFKGLDDNKSYALNLSTKFPNEVAKWESFCKVGNVLDINLQANGKNVNYFASFTPTRIV